METDQQYTRLIQISNLEKKVEELRSELKKEMKDNYSLFEEKVAKYSESMSSSVRSLAENRRNTPDPFQK